MQLHEYFILTRYALAACARMPCVFGTKTYLPNMTHFLKAVEQFDDPRQLFLMDAFESLSEANSGLLFFGDSTINVSTADM